MGESHQTPKEKGVGELTFDHNYFSFKPPTQEGLRGMTLVQMKYI